MFAAVREAVGRDVEDGHHLRLIERDRPIAGADRRPRRDQARENRMAGFVEHRGEALDGHKGLPHAASVLGLDQLDSGETGEPAGEAQHLAVMIRGGVDEACRAEIDLPAHRPPIAWRGVGSIQESQKGMVHAETRRGGAGRQPI